MDQHAFMLTVVAASASVIAAIAAIVGIGFVVSNYLARKRSELPTVKLEPIADDMFLVSLEHNAHSFGWRIRKVAVAYSDIGLYCISQSATEPVGWKTRPCESGWKQTCDYPQGEDSQFIYIHCFCFHADLVFTCETPEADWRRLWLRKSRKKVTHTFQRDLIEALEESPRIFR